jgi:DNA-binding response OmpR family regulator
MTPFTTPPPRVLVVDDDPDVLRTIADMVRRGGYTVLRRSRFDEAKRFIDDTPPDMLVTDVRLGAFNGLQLVLHMRQARPEGAVVVLSAWDDPVIRHDAERAGARFLAKPVKRQDLLAALAQAGGATVETA